MHTKWKYQWKHGAINVVMLRIFNFNLVHTCFYTLNDLFILFYWWQFYNAALRISKLIRNSKYGKKLTKYKSPFFFFPEMNVCTFVECKFSKVSLYPFYVTVVIRSFYSSLLLTTLTSIPISKCNFWLMLSVRYSSKRIHFPIPIKTQYNIILTITSNT